MHDVDLNPVLHEIFNDTKTLAKKKKQKVIEVTAGRMCEILYEHGARFDPNGEEIIWPGGCKTFKTSDMQDFLGPSKKGRPKKSKPRSEKFLDEWSKKNDASGFGKRETLFKINFIFRIIYIN